MIHLLKLIKFNIGAKTCLFLLLDTFDIFIYFRKKKRPAKHNQSMRLFGTQLINTWILTLISIHTFSTLILFPYFFSWICCFKGFRVINYQFYINDLYKCSYYFQSHIESFEQLILVLLLLILSCSTFLRSLERCT